jgi:prepilin-type processing-associated H-X9-DG protein
MGDAALKKRRLMIIAVAVLAVVGLGILIITVRRNLDLRQRLICGTRIKSVGTAFKIYAGEHGLESADAIRFLVAQGALKAEDTICPASGKPFLLAPISPARFEDVSPQDVIAYEPLAYHGGTGANILFGDGHASFTKPDQYQEAIAQSQAAGSWDVGSNGLPQQSGE